MLLVALVTTDVYHAYPQAFLRWLLSCWVPAWLCGVTVLCLLCSAVHSQTPVAHPGRAASSCPHSLALALIPGCPAVHLSCSGIEGQMLLWGLQCPGHCCVAVPGRNRCWENCGFIEKTTLVNNQHHLQVLSTKMQQFWNCWRSSGGSSYFSLLSIK